MEVGGEEEDRGERPRSWNQKRLLYRGVRWPYKLH